MMDPHQLNFELIVLLGQFCRQVADSGAGSLSDEVAQKIGPVAATAHKQATDLLRTLESDEFEDLWP